MTFPILAIALGLMPAAAAHVKGRDFGRWWLYGALLFPVALIHALVMNHEWCPYCKGATLHEATVCRHCGRDLDLCPECHAPVGAAADECPSCGYELQPEAIRQRLRKER